MTKEKIEEIKEEKKIGQTLVVSELPKVEARTFIDENNVEHPLITKDEAETEMLNILRKLEKLWDK